MYSTCIFCQQGLGRNEAIEHFPVGRRLAFDESKGRLWVVCRKCERWNLTPLEERWEAIEECERAFRATKLRVSTDHIGLARLSEGTELVRIGDPQRPEMAAWRYGDQFGRRTRRNAVYGAGFAVMTAGIMWGGPALGVSATAVSAALQVGLHWHHRRCAVAHISVASDDGQVQRLALARMHVARTSLGSDRDGRWWINVPYLSAGERLIYTSRGLRHLTERVQVSGEDAHRAAAQILPHVNPMVGRARTVQDAVRVLEEKGGAEPMFAAAARVRPNGGWTLVHGKVMVGSLASLPAELRLALEMSVHEDAERRALEGELHELERAWKDAEEIAGIADDMFLPDSVTADLARLKRLNEG